MSKKPVMAAFLLLTTPLVAQKKSSAIPDRREFPVNPAISPCDNFYEYACSKVNDSFELPADRSRHNFAFGDSFERILEYKKKYFASLAEAKTQNDVEKELKDVYVACMDKGSRTLEERDLVSAAIREVAQIKDLQGFKDLLSSKMMVGEPSFLGFGRLANQDKPEMNDLYIDTDLMSLPEKSYYDNTAILTDLENLYAEFFQSLGLLNPGERARKVLVFEKALAEIYPTPLEFRQLMATRTGITKEDLLTKFPELNLGSLLVQVPPHTHIRDFIPKTMEYLNERMKREPLDTLKDIYLLTALSPYMDDAYQSFWQKRFDLQHKYLGGPEKRPPRQEECTRMIMSDFTMELDSLLLPKMFPNFPAEKFVAMAEKVRGSILASLQENEWLTPDAKAEAIRKTKSAKLQLVKPLTDEEWNFNPKADYSPKAAIANAKLLSKVQIEKVLNEFKGPVSKDRWGMGPLTINAYYHPSYNKFVLPVGILQYPFYDPNLPEEINLAAIGSVIGHELGHGIDDKGSKFDASGQLKTWMSDKDLEAFKTRSSSLVQQFNKIGHNGELTLGENIGDLVGLTASYRAAFKGKKYDKEMTKKFFLQYARSWCEVQRPTAAERRLKTDPHSLGYARVNEQVKHQPDFAKAYSCKEGDKLVLPAKEVVKIW
ncbi:MAG: M13 family metallopeptidase [Oligoflexales bacterium]